MSVLSALSKSRSKANALDMLRSKVMLADHNLKITFVNDSLAGLLEQAEADIRAELPRFSMATLIGSNIDIFHKNPAHQRSMLAVLDKPHSAMIRVGRHVFDLMVIPLKQGNRRVGFVVEWADAKERLLNVDYAAQIAAIGRAQAIIEFTVDGTVISANANCLEAFGYTIDEVKGKHHRMFMPVADQNSPEYTAFWDALRRGEYQSAAFRRVRKGGGELWIQGSYNPILDTNGQVVKIVKFATDITSRVNAAGSIGTAMTALAEGDLVQRLTSPLTPEFEQLRTDFNAATQTLEETMRQFTQSAAAIRSGSEEIRLSSDDLSRRTEQQAASLQETATALDQITTTVKATSEGALSAQAAVSTAKTDAGKSAILVRRAVEAMTNIENSSTEISQIIGVIDEIAFQTNLLALNAGVEAARAGDAGRGFAVVASEVRALAQRSAEAAKQIKALISTSTTQVVEGVRLVGETGTAIEGIELQVGNINGVIADIAASAREQSTSLAEVNAAINQMDQVTQQNAAMAEQANAASHSLAEETQILADLAARFTTSVPSPTRAAHQPATLPSRSKPNSSLKVVGGNIRRLGQ